MANPINGGATEIRSTREILSFRVRHLNDDEYTFAPALAMEGPTGTVFVTPGQLAPLITALVEMMEEVL